MKRTQFVVLLIVLFGVSHIYGQTEVTPTPAPTKTPDVSVEEVIPDVDINEDSESITLIEPFTQSDLIVLNGNVQRPNGIGWFNDKLYAVCNGDWTLYEIDDTTGSTRTYIYGVRNAHSMYVESLTGTDLNLWIPDYDTNSLLRVNQSGAPREIVTGLEGPWGIALLDETHFLVTNLSGDSVSLISREGEVNTVLTEMRSPTGIVVKDDIAYIANNGSSRRSIEWVSTDELSDSGGSPELSSLVSGLQNTTNLVMGPDDLLYFTYALGTRGVVGRIDPNMCLDDGCTNDQVEIVLYTELAAPLAGLTISPDMRLFVHTIFRPEIYWVQLEPIDEPQEQS